MASEVLIDSDPSSSLVDEANIKPDHILAKHAQTKTRTILHGQSGNQKRDRNKRGRLPRDKTRYVCWIPCSSIKCIPYLSISYIFVLEHLPTLVQALFLKCTSFSSYSPVDSFQALAIVNAFGSVVLSLECQSTCTVYEHKMYNNNCCFPADNVEQAHFHCLYVLSRMTHALHVLHVIHASYNVIPPAFPYSH